MKYVCLILLLSFTPLLRAQTLISGRVTGPDQKPLPTVNITAKNEGKILAFAITKADGSYQLKITAPADSLLVTLSKMGFANQEHILPNQSRQLDFVLQKGDFTLKEVKVESPPVRRRGDTLSYKVEEFQSAADRTIGDVIKKMPGMEVDPDGKIYYQGKPINRYYVEDMNLLDGRYNLVNENLPHGKVATVQVYENHQPIRALDSLRPSERAAINIRLKNKVTKTGNFQYGAGLKPFLWNVNATPIVFVPNFQFLASVRSNNTGENLFPMFYDSFQSELFSKENWLEVSSVNPPGFASKRWMDNRSHALSVNTLKKSRQSLEMKLNTSLILDQQKRTGASATTYFLSNETIRFSENVHSRFRTNHLSGTLEFIKNVPKAYFTNKLTLEKEWRADQGENDRIARLYYQENNTGNLRISNNFHRIFTRKNKTYNFYSLVSYAGSFQALNVSLTGTDSLASPFQDFAHRGFTTHNYADFTVRIKNRVSVSLRTGSQIGLSHIKTELSGHELRTDTLNDFRWNTFRTYVSGNMLLKPGKWTFMLNFPLAHYHITYTPGGRRTGYLQTDGRRTFNRLVPEPMLSVRLKSTPSLEWNSYFQYQNSVARLGDIYPGHIMRSYLSVVSRNTDFTNNQRFSGGAGVTFNHVTSGLSFNANLGATRNILNQLPQNHILPDGSGEVRYTTQKNISRMRSGRAQVTQYFFGLKTTVSAGVTLSELLNEQSLNGSLNLLSNRTVTPNARITLNRFKRMELNYTTQYGYSRMGNTAETVKQFQQQVGMALSAVKNTTILLSAEQVRISRQNYFFSDLTLRYTPPKIKQDFELGVVNLFNQDTFRNIYLRDYLMQETIFQLRPRQFLLRGSFRL